jgi:hypothetical protein
MKKYLMATVGETGRLYFVPEGDKYNGVFVDKGKMLVVPIFDFIHRNSDVEPIKQTNRQKKFWKMDFNDPRWAREHFVELKNSTSGNKYNRRARVTMDAIDDISSSRQKRRPNN